jgi:deoxyhypusine synthase
VPVYTSSPGDSSIGMNVAALALDGNACVIDPNLDVNETAAIVLEAKRGGRANAGELAAAGAATTKTRKKGGTKRGAVKKESGASAVLILGGGSPKNFVLQTEPQIQEVLGIDERGHDYFLQVTDARADTGGLSGATPGEAVSWGKIDPDRLPDAVVCYTDSTLALPLLTAYALARHAPRPLARLYERRGAMMQRLTQEYVRSRRSSPKR